MRPHYRKHCHHIEFTLDLLEKRELLTNYFVATTGNDANSGTAASPFRTIQFALDSADSPGDTIHVRGGTYHEKLVFRHGGDESGAITLQAAAGENVILDGTSVDGHHMVLIEDVSYVKLIGFEIRNNIGVEDGSGVRVQGAGTAIEIRDNEIHHMLGTNAMGITVYGQHRESISHIVIHNNHVHDLEAAPSEAVTVNGNVEYFEITSNLVHDVNSIGIDAIGGERDINRRRRLVARDGIIRGNTVFNARSTYEDGFGAGIYVDGGRDIVVENNEVYQSDLGIEIGAENRGVTARNIVVRNNIVRHNDKAGLVVGGYARRVGRVKYSSFYNNTVYANDTLETGFGQVWIQYALRNVFVNNIFVAGDNDRLIYSENGNRRNAFDFNVWHTIDGSAGTFVWRSEELVGMAEFQDRSKQGSDSIFANPQFVAAAAHDFRLVATSPAIDLGTHEAGLFASHDRDGVQRPQGGGVDAGAYEFVP